MLDQLFHVNNAMLSTRGKKLEKRTCTKCGLEYQPVLMNQSFCSDCSRKAHKSTKAVWQVYGTDQLLTHAQLQQQLEERTLPIGTRLEHDNNGSYSVILKNDKYILEKITE